MEIGLRKLFVSLLLLPAGTAAGANLCNQDCLLTIAFPGGGSIEAVESLTITFGDGGLVDTVGSVTAYVAGETLSLNAGEALDFGNGGSFDIGNGGNIDYTDMEITTDGVGSISAVGGDRQILIPAGSRLALFGGGLINDNSTVVVQGTLEFGTDTTLNISGPAQPDGCDLSSPGGATLSISGSGPLILDNNSGCTNLATNFGTGPVLSGGSLSLTDPATSLVVANFDPPITLLTAGSLTLDETDEEPKTDDTSEESDGSGAGSPGLHLLLLLAALAAAARRPAAAGKP